MKKLESVIFAILKEHPSTEEILTDEVSAVYPICIFFCRNSTFASVEVRIALSNLIEKGMIDIFFRENKTFLTVKKDNQSF